MKSGATFGIAYVACTLHSMLSVLCNALRVLCEAYAHGKRASQRLYNSYYCLTTFWQRIKKDFCASTDLEIGRHSL